MFEFGKDKIASPNKKYGTKRNLDRRENPGLITAEKLENGRNWVPANQDSKDTSPIIGAKNWISTLPKQVCYLNIECEYL